MLPLRGPRLSATPNLRGLSPDTKPLTPHPCKSFSVKRGFLHKNDGAKHFFCARSTPAHFPTDAVRTQLPRSADGRDFTLFAALSTMSYAARKHLLPLTLLLIAHFSSHIAN